MAAKKTPVTAPKPEEDDSLLNTVARTVGSTLGTIVARTEDAIEKRDEILETLKGGAAEIRERVRSAGRATRSAMKAKKSRVGRKRAATSRNKAAPVRKKAASKGRNSSTRARRKTSK